MTPDDGAKAQEEPAFDPATWTPDKPWPKGYYKPVPGLTAAMERADRIGGNDTGSRLFFWGLLGGLSQWAGLAVARPTPLQPFGLAAIAVQRLVGPWPLPVFFILLLPALLYAAIIPRPGMPFLRSFAYGLGWALALRVFFMLLAWLAGLPR